MYWINYSPRHDFFRPRARDPVVASRHRQTPAEWKPGVDIREEPECFVLSMDIPGVDPGTVKIEMHEGVLSINGERRLASSEKSSYTLNERGGGHFSRRFRLPEMADADQIKARSEQGVLEVIIPKSSSRRIKVTH